MSVSLHLASMAARVPMILPASNATVLRATKATLANLVIIKHTIYDPLAKRSSDYVTATCLSATRGIRKFL